jgi:hypothetical protein
MEEMPSQFSLHNILAICPYNIQLKVILQVRGFPRDLCTELLSEFNVSYFSHVTDLRGFRDYPSDLALVKVKVNVKVKFTLKEATNAQRGSRGLALLFL